jgi:hypothetical protein
MWMHRNPPTSSLVERRVKQLVGLALVVLAAAACASGTISALPPVDSTGASLSVHLSAARHSAQAFLVFGDTKHQGVGGSNCWSWADAEGNGTTRCADTSGAEQAPDVFTVIPTSSTLFITGDARTAVGVVAKAIREKGLVRLEVVQRLDLTDGQATIDVSPGEYTLQIDGLWDQGKVPFYFGIRVNQASA